MEEVKEDVAKNDIEEIKEVTPSSKKLQIAEYILIFIVPAGFLCLFAYYILNPVYNDIDFMFDKYVEIFFALMFISVWIIMHFNKPKKIKSEILWRVIIVAVNGFLIYLFRLVGITIELDITMYTEFMTMSFSAIMFSFLYAFIEYVLYRLNNKKQKGKFNLMSSLFMLSIFLTGVQKIFFNPELIDIVMILFMLGLFFYSKLLDKGEKQGLIINNILFQFLLIIMSVIYLILSIMFFNWHFYLYYIIFILNVAISVLSFKKMFVRLKEFKKEN